MLGRVAEWDPPFLCSTGWRPSLGPFVDGTVCAVACRAKKFKIVRAAGAGPFGNLSGPDARSRHAWRGELSSWWLPTLPCLEPCRTHIVIDVVCFCTSQSESQTTDPGKFPGAWIVACSPLGVPGGDVLDLNWSVVRDEICTGRGGLDQPMGRPPRLPWSQYHGAVADPTAPHLRYGRRAADL